MSDPANNPVNDLQIIKLHISFDIPWNIDPKNQNWVKSLPKQEPNKDNSRNGFLPYLSLNGPIIRRPILKEAIMSNTYHLKYRIGTKNNAFLKTIWIEFFHEIG